MELCGVPRKRTRSLLKGIMSKKIEYVDIRTATAEQMEYAFGRERELVLQLLTQIKTDLESFNENWNKER